MPVVTRNEYQPRQPETTLLHALVRDHFRTLKDLSADPDDPTLGLPEFVVREFEAFLACGDPSHGFARLKCGGCGLERLLAFSCKTRTLCPSCASRRMFQTAAFLVDHVLPDVPLRQWVLSPPFPLVALLGGRETEGGALRFVEAAPPAEVDMVGIAREVATAMAKLLERLGLLDDTDESRWSPLMRWYRGVLRDGAGLGTVDAHGQVRGSGPGPQDRGTGEAHGFSVHARVTVRADDRAARERLCRYAARPPLADAQLSVTDDGRVAVHLRRPRHDGATHVVLEPERFLRRLAWLIPHPRKPQIRFAGVLAPHAKWRRRVVLDPPPPSRVLVPSEEVGTPVRPQRAAAIPWRVLLRRVHDLDALACDRCGGRLRPIALIIDPKVARRILDHLSRTSEPSEARRAVLPRGPP